MIDTVEYCSFPSGFPIIKGNYNELIDADYEVQRMIDILKEEVQNYTNREFSQLRAINFRRQSKYGTNYIVKVYVGSNEYIHVRFLRPMPCTGLGLKLGAVQTNKTFEDPITAF